MPDMSVCRGNMLPITEVLRKTIVYKTGDQSGGSDETFKTSSLWTQWDGEGQILGSTLCRHTQHTPKTHMQHGPSVEHPLRVSQTHIVQATAETRDLSYSLPETKCRKNCWWYQKSSWSSTTEQWSSRCSIHSKTSGSECRRKSEPSRLSSTSTNNYHH